MKYSNGYPITSTGHCGTCGSCNHWAEGKPGTCHRFPPKEYAWSKTWTSDTCGEYSENKAITNKYHKS